MAERGLNDWFLSSIIEDGLIQDGHIRQEESEGTMYKDTEMGRLGILRFKRGEQAPVNATDYSILGKLNDPACSHCYGRGYEVVDGKRNDCRCTTLYIMLTSKILTPQVQPGPEEAPPPTIILPS
jgi:hypothetical protein